MKLLQSYFPEITGSRAAAFQKLLQLYPELNNNVNVISRKDIDLLEERHVLHSLAIAKFIQFKSGAKVLDVGTGGGFPGVPLAVFFPDVQFHLVDSIGKKIKVINEVVAELNLQNCKAEQKRAEKVKGKYDFVVSRAVAPVEKLMMWNRKSFVAECKHNIKNGFIFLKGGDLQEEIKAVQQKISFTNIGDYYKEDFFETKKILHIPMHP